MLYLAILSQLLGSIFTQFVFGNVKRLRTISSVQNALCGFC
jgi:hypothetical protein